LIFKS
jgi:hypothetical protein